MKKKAKVKVRRQWNLHPATRVETTRTDYDRRVAKRELKKRVEEEAREEKT